MLGFGYFGAAVFGATTFGGFPGEHVPPVPAAAVSAGKYKPEHAAALRDLAGAHGFASEHAGASNDLRDAGI